MSTNARRLTGSVSTDKFQWQRAKGSAKPSVSRLAPVAFTPPTSAAGAVTDTRPDVEARELHLPSVTNERLQAIEREAFAGGHARGLQAAETETARRLEEMMTRLGATIADVAGLRVGVMRRAERELVHLALAMAERIVRRQLDTDPELLLVIARVAIDRLGERAAAIVHLNPADHEIVVRRNPEGAQGIELVADASIPRAGCLIRSAVGEIDAGIDAQIRELSRELLGVDDGEETSDGAVVRA